MPVAQSVTPLVDGTDSMDGQLHAGQSIGGAVTMSSYYAEVPETWIVDDDGVYATLSEDLTMWVVWKSENEGDTTGFEVGLYENDDLISAAHWEWQDPDIAEFIQVVPPVDALTALADVEGDEEKEDSSPRRPVWLQVAFGLGKGVWIVLVYAVKFVAMVIKALPAVMAVMEELYQAIDDLMTGRRSGRRRRRPTQNEKKALHHQQKGRCRGCRRRFAMRNLEVDHITPVSAGGSDLYDNKQLLCGSCNRIKGTKTQAQLKSALRRKRII